jgi:serine/threonine-protein kinase
LRAETVTMAIAPGTRFGPYQVGEPLGSGGMGEVYRARDTKLGRDVAIKTLPSTFAGDKERLARFEREAKLLAALNHAHIATVHALDEHDGTLYVAMELVEGQTLEEKLKSGALQVEDALRLALQIAEALEAAHGKGVIHRDLKPANVMVTANDVVKVLDFGLAKAFMGDPNVASPAHSPALSLAMTQQGLVLGTAGYMAPEQASAQATDQRADIWAFGVVLYEMLTGMPMFTGESVPHILADVLRTEPDWSRLPKSLHPRVRLMLERCLEKKPRNRYHSIAEARVDIESALQDPGGGIVRYGLVAPGPSPWHRRLLPWAAAIAVGALASLAAWTLKAPPPQATQATIRAVQRLAEGQEFLFDAYPAIAISRDGSRFVYNTTDGLNLRSVDAFDSVQVPGSGLPRSSPVFSPDGQALAMITNRNPGISEWRPELARLPLTGGALRPLGFTGVTSFGDTPLGLSWEIDDTIVYAVNDGVWRMPANGGSRDLVIKTGAGERAGMATLLPGAEWVLFSLVKAASNDWDSAEIVAQSLATGERRVLHSGGSSARYVPTGHLVYADGNTLYALPFDVDTIEVSSRPPIPVVQGVLHAAGTGVAQYAFSDTGTLLYIPFDTVMAGRESLAVVDGNGGVERFPTPVGVHADPRVSPDGRQAAYTTSYPDGDDITVHELAGSAAPRRLTFGGQSRFPAWSSDGTRIAFQSTRDGTASLYWLVADGSAADPDRLTTAAEGETHVPDSFSPDGQWLTFTAATENDVSVRLMDLRSGEAEALLERSGAAVSQSVFSPNGRWLAYQSTETGATEIFVQPFPSSGARFQLPHVLENHHPAWSPDGTEMFYFPFQALTQSVPISANGGLSFGPAERIVDLPMNRGPMTRRQYDVMPDGSGFLGFVAGGTEDADGAAIHIVFNWFDELERLVPAD